jgi:hypothetical protein
MLMSDIADIEVDVDAHLCTEGRSGYRAERTHAAREASNQIPARNIHKKFSLKKKKSRHRPTAASGRKQVVEY